MLDDLRYRLTALFRRKRLERDLDDELQFHLEQHAAIDERAGVPPEEALRRARLAFGGVDRAKEESRDSRGVRAIEVVWRDLRYAVRTLARSPIFTLVAILSLTLGIGANTAMFQLLNALVLRTLPVAEPQELVEINLPPRDLAASRANHHRWPALSYLQWEQVRERQGAFSAMFAWADDRFNLAPAGEVRHVPGVWVSGDYFPVLGLTPAIGRLFAAADDRPGCGRPGAVVSYDFWQRELGGDAGALGRTLTVNAVSVDVIGVAPDGFNGLQIGQSFDVALPICSLPTVYPGNDRLTSGDHWLTAMGRLKPGWTLERAEAHLRTLAPGIFAASLPPDYPVAGVQAYLASTLSVSPAASGRSDLRGAYATPLRLLLAMTGFVLLIACANLTNLLLARGAVRQRELSLRLALGASRGRLISQLLCESAAIAGTSALAGAFLAQVLSRTLVRLIGSTRDPVVLTLSPDWRLLLFMGATALTICLLLGLTPALRVSRGAPGDALKTVSRGVTGDRESLNLRRALVVAQVAVSLVLVVGALLFARSFRNMLAEPLGFEPDGALFVQTSLSPPLPPEADAALGRELIASLRAVPGVEAVGESMIWPLSGNNPSSPIWMDGASRAEARESSFNRISRGYFDALGMRLLAGRDISDADTRASPLVAVVNETFARTFTPGGSPVGRRFSVEPSSSTSPVREYAIVGLVADAKFQRFREEPRPVAFISLAQRGGPGIGGTFMVRTAASIQSVLPALRDALTRAHPNLRFVVRTFDGEVRDALSRERVMAMLSSLFGGLAALLAAVGLHGVVSYAVERRRREIGIRLALGASRGAIVRSVLRESGILIGAGLVLGVVLSVAVTGAARTLLFGLEPRDAGTIAAAVAALTLVALTASLVPAQRAARVDPMSTLKED